jgi:hypothetical protein
MVEAATAIPVLASKSRRVIMAFLLASIEDAV